MVGATFLATNYRPSLDMIRQYDRKSLENNRFRSCSTIPAIGFVRIQGPFNAQRPGESRSLRKVFTCQPTAPAQEDRVCDWAILTTLARRAYRRPATPPDVDGLRAFSRKDAKTATFEDGIELALRRCSPARSSWCGPSANLRTVSAGPAYRIRRPRTRVATLVLPMEQHSRRRR